MTRFTKAFRQQIIREYAENNGGIFDPAGFLEACRDPEHPAHSWFEWDDDKAALEYRLDQARDFARGLKITFEVRTVAGGKMRIRQATAPLALSPIDGRKDGGGYYLTDPQNEAHLEELRKQAAQSLRWFLMRYHSVIEQSGIDYLERLQRSLEAQERLEAA